MAAPEVADTSPVAVVADTSLVVAVVADTSPVEAVARTVVARVPMVAQPLAELAPMVARLLQLVVRTVLLVAMITPRITASSNSNSSMPVARPREVLPLVVPLPAQAVLTRPTPLPWQRRGQITMPRWVTQAVVLRRSNGTTSSLGVGDCSPPCLLWLCI